MERQIHSSSPCPGPWRPCRLLSEEILGAIKSHSMFSPPHSHFVTPFPWEIGVGLLTLHHLEVVGLVGTLSRFRLTLPSHSCLIPIISLSGVATPWKDLSFYFLLPIFKKSWLVCPWVRRANQSLRTGSRCSEAASHRPSCSCAGLGVGKQGPLCLSRLLFSVAAPALSHLPGVPAPVPGWSQVSWAALVLLGEIVVLEERAISHGFSCSALLLSFTQVAMSAHAPAHIPSLPFSLFVCFFSWQVQKVQVHTQLLSTDSIWESVVGRSAAGGSRVWSLLTRGKAAGRDRHTQRQIPVTQGQELHNHTEVWRKHFLIGHIHLIY